MDTAASPLRPHRLEAFYGRQSIKQLYLDRVKAHREADNLIQGAGWVKGKGCAVGCTLEQYKHSQYEVELGIPAMLAHLEDVIFEGLPAHKAQAWPERFLTAIEPGANLSRVGWQFLYWLLTEGKIPGADHPLVRDEIRACADVLLPLKEGLPADGLVAHTVFGGAAYAATCAARITVDAANAAYDIGADYAAYAAYAGIYSCRAVYTDRPDCAAYAAIYAGRVSRWPLYKTMADKLIELLEDAGLDVTG